MKKSIVFNSCGAVLLFGLSVSASADEVSIGFGGAWYQSPYIGEDSKLYPWPLIQYDSERFFVSGASAGAHIWQNSNQQLNALVQFQPLALKPSKNDDAHMKRLDRRKSTLLAGASYSVKGKWGRLQGEALTDVLDNSRSVRVDLQYAYHMQPIERLSLFPQIGVTWENNKHNRYYYGVSEDESQRSGYTVYRPNDSVTPYAGLRAGYRFNENWQATIGYRFFLLDREVKSSPIVNRSNSHALTFGVLYRFK